MTASLFIHLHRGASRWLVSTVAPLDMHVDRAFAAMRLTATSMVGLTCCKHIDLGVVLWASVLVTEH